MAGKEKSGLRGRFWRSYISSVISISLVLFIVGLFAVLFFSTRRISAYFKENVKVSVMLSDQVSKSQAEQLALNFAQMPQVLTAELVSQEQGTMEMKEFLGEDFMEVFESNPTPTSVDLRLREGYFTADSLVRLKEILCSDPMVTDVIYEEDLISAINRNLRVVGIIASCFAVLLALVSTVLINNTVRLNIYSRRFAVRTMQLVGATRGFIRRPFIRNSVLQGALGGIFATILLFGALYLAQREFPQLQQIVGTETFLYCGAGLIVLGILLCALCTFSVVRKMTDMPADKLYF